MTDLAIHLERLGLEQYLDAFIAEGFDLWDTLLDIQESDLDALGVKLGHRRKLQRAIADFRGISYERLIDAKQSDGYTGEGSISEGQPPEGSVTGSQGGSAPPSEQKRKYRRHPKPDENAPDKPPSAYVLFSNKVREDVKSENLSFTEIAKLVGERWQKLDPAHKEPFESHAQALKESYHLQLSAYKKTDSHRHYAQYLADFKVKHGQVIENKRPKLDPQSSGGSISATSQDLADASIQVPAHVRGGSMGSIGTTSQTGGLPSPTAFTNSAPFPTLTTATSTGFAQLPMARPVSPSSSPYGGDRRRVGQLSTQSSVSDDSGQLRNDTQDSLSRTAALSLSTPPAGTPPLLPNLPGAPRLEHSASSESFAWPVPRHPQHASSLSSPHGTGLALPSPSINADPWRERAQDAQRQPQTSSSPRGVLQPPLTLAPIIAPDRLPDLTRAQSQRTLPPPLRQYPTAPHTSYITHQISQTQSPGQSNPRTSLPIEHHESEAATTLAGLAKRPAEDQGSRRGDAR